MGDKSNIEWTDATWNPVRGCSLVSAGCTNCYAMRVAHRFSGDEQPYAGLTKMTSHGPVWTGAVTLHPELLDQPLRWKRPRRIFVNSMSDLFHDNVPAYFIDQVFAVMLACAALDNRRHTFQILTKRPARMHAYLTSRTPAEHLQAWAKAGDGLVQLDNADELFSEHVERETSFDWDDNGRNSSGSEYKPWGYLSRLWPLPNVQLGVSVEDQPTADERIVELLQTPAAVRWISAEPLLGPIDLLPRLHRHPIGCEGIGIYDWTERLDWVVVGGESGPRARPMHPDWVRSLRDQCNATGVPFFFKQWGEWLPVETVEESRGHDLLHYFDDVDMTFVRQGKKLAGRELDARTWSEYPT